MSLILIVCMANIFYGLSYLYFVYNFIINSNNNRADQIAYNHQSIKMDLFSWRHMSRKSESEVQIDGCQWHGM